MDSHMRGELIETTKRRKNVSQSKRIGNRQHSSPRKTAESSTSRLRLRERNSDLKKYSPNTLRETLKLTVNTSQALYELQKKEPEYFS